MVSYTLDYALRSWATSPPAQKVGVNFGKNLRVALCYYVLPELDDQVQVLKPKEFEEYARRFELRRLKEAMEIFESRTNKAISMGKLSAKTKANYRSALGQFMRWMEQQVWWQELFADTRTEVAPFRPKFTKPTTKKRFPSYGLRKDELPEELKKEIEEFQQFRITGGQNLRRSRRERRRVEGSSIGTRPKLIPVKERTLQINEEMILKFLGWYQHFYPENILSLRLLTQIELLDEFTYWVVTNRGASYSIGKHVVTTGIAVAKWLNYAQCYRRDWSDIPLILDLQDLQSEYSEIYEQEKKKQQSEKWASKELTHEQARKVVQYLQLLCAPQYGKHHRKTGKFRKHGNRPLSAIVRAWQTYIIVKFLVYCPVRQEEIRHLVLGETIFRHLDQSGNPYYIVRLKEHKRSKYGKERHYQLPSILTADLDMWIYQWRPLMAESIQSLETWMDFWGRSSDKVERMKNRLELAKEGILNDGVKQSVEDYILQEESRLQGALNRREAWEQAQQNFNSHNYLFFMMARGEPTSFGKPHDVGSVWAMVRRAIALATTALFGESKWTNPHALRHIAEKHIRLLNKPDMLESFGTLIGHSKEMGDLYAAQIMTDYELAQKVVDDWWV